MKKMQIFFLILLFLLLTIPVKDYPISGDTAFYTELMKNIYEKGSYESFGEVHTLYPPVFPLVSVPFYIMTMNPADAIRLSSIFWGVIFTIILFFIFLEFKFKWEHSIGLTALIILNPYFFYFCASFPCSEAVALSLFYLGFLLYMRSNGKDKNYYFSGVLFGLSIVARFPFIALVTPIAIYDLYLFIKSNNKSKWKDFKSSVIYLLRPLLIGIPVLVWLVRNYLVSPTHEITGYFVLIPYMRSFFLNFWVYLLLTIPITLMLIFPFFYKELLNIKKHKIEFRVFLYSALVYFIVICFLSNDFWQFIINKGSFSVNNLIITAFALTRYTLPILPLGVLMVFLSIRDKNKLFRRLLVASISVSLILLVAFNYGFIQSAVDKSAYFPSTFSYRSYVRAEGIRWINDNVQPESKVLVLFSDPGETGMYQINYFVSDYFRNDLAISTEGEPKDYDYIVSDNTAYSDYKIVFNRGKTANVVVYEVS